jgi:hypothetical protein
MKLGIMQAYFFPYIGYFQLINQVDQFILYEHVTFRKDSWIYRNRILAKNAAEPFFLVVPVQSKSSNKKISETLLNSDGAWKPRLLKTIYFCYKKARFFDETFPVVEKLIRTPSQSLQEYNAASLSGICTHLGLRTTIVSDNRRFLAMERELDEIYRDSTTRPAHLPEKKTLRIVNICRQEGASTYFNPINGVGLYQKAEFRKYGIDLQFLERGNLIYQQFREEFTPDLSIIDVLMHAGREQTIELLKIVRFQ